MPLSSHAQLPSAYFKPISLHHVDVSPTADIGLLAPYHCCIESFNIAPSASYVILVLSPATNNSDFDKSITLSVAADAVNGIAVITAISKMPDNKIDNAFFILFSPLLQYICRYRPAEKTAVYNSSFEHITLIYPVIPTLSIERTNFRWKII